MTLKSSGFRDQAQVGRGYTGLNSPVHGFKCIGDDKALVLLLWLLVLVLLLLARTGELVIGTSEGTSVPTSYESNRAEQTDRTKEMDRRRDGLG
jgi:hypothetical protein